MIRSRQTVHLAPINMIFNVGLCVRPDKGMLYNCMDRPDQRSIGFPIIRGRLWFGDDSSRSRCPRFERSSGSHTLHDPKAIPTSVKDVLYIHVAPREVGTELL